MSSEERRVLGHAVDTSSRAPCGRSMPTFLGLVFGRRYVNNFERIYIGYRYGSRKTLKGAVPG